MTTLSHEPGGTADEQSGGAEWPQSQTSAGGSGPDEKRVRRRHTIYLPVDLSRWFVREAIETERERSEVAEEALRLLRHTRSARKEVHG